MLRLHIQLDYTVGTADNFRWLQNAIPPHLTQLGLVALVYVNSNATRAVKDSFTHSQLHNLTEKIIDKSSLRKEAERIGDWYLHLLITTSHLYTNYLGLMYDFKFDSRYRQGCAVFTNAISSIAGKSPENFQKAMLRTILHEIGHCLNLIHRNDKSLMAQTSNIMTSNNSWFNRISYDFAHEDRSFVRNNPNDCKPGGNRVRLGLIEDEIYKNDKLKLIIQQFQDKKVREYTSGAPVSLLVKIYNSGSGKVKLPLPLDVTSENVLVWIKRPGKKTELLQKAILTCGNKLEHLTIEKKGYKILPVHLFADTSGYLFNDLGTYKVKIALKVMNKNWYCSRYFSFNIVEPPKKEVVIKKALTTPEMLKFIVLGGTEKKSTKTKVKNILRKAPTSELCRPLYWNIMYEVKAQMQDHIGKNIYPENDMNNLLNICTNLIKAENSEIRKGKAVKEIQKVKAALGDAENKLPTEEFNFLQKYESIEKSLIKKS